MPSTLPPSCAAAPAPAPVLAPSSLRPPRRHLTAQATLASPLGQILIARTERGLSGLWFEGQKDHPAVLDAPFRADDALLADVAGQLQAYWTLPPGRRHRFDVPLDLDGTAFQQEVWQALMHLEHGHTCSYGHIARMVGRPGGSRAVGAAVGRNPVSIIVPCHRVVGQSAQLTGYTGGMHRKIALLQREGHGVNGSRLQARPLTPAMP